MKSTTRKALDLRSVKMPSPAARASDETYFEVLDISPEMATKFLETNHDNRPLGQTRIEAFASPTATWRS